VEVFATQFTGGSTIIFHTVCTYIYNYIYIRINIMFIFCISYVYSMWILCMSS
jgi:hypothetical protein